MNELVVISGKGGTGKTSIVASFASLAEKVVLADCDVDAADLHLVLQPTVRERHAFSGGSRARIMRGEVERSGGGGDYHGLASSGRAFAGQPAVAKERSAANGVETNILKYVRVLESGNET